MQFIDLNAQQARIKSQIDERIQSVLAHGKYILGPEVEELESKLAEFCGVRHAVTCANGTDALQLALMAFGIGSGQAVFCPSFTFAATAEVIVLVGAVPVFVDVDPVSFNMDVGSLQSAISYARDSGLRPAAIIPVDLFGHPADYDVLNECAEREGLVVIADSAQSFGAVYQGRPVGTLGEITTTSFFPAKPLGCYGDGGAVFTDRDDLADLIRSLRFHGKGDHKYTNVRVGLNSRLDTFQAAILLEKLAIYKDEIDARQRVAQRYSDGLCDVIEVPKVGNECQSVWAQYTLKACSAEEREALMAALKSEGIPSTIYYPLPLHQQQAYSKFLSDPAGLKRTERLAEQVFSLPMHPYLDEVQQERVISCLRSKI